MLGRAADNLFWMSRTMERVENTVRLIKTCRTATMLSDRNDANDTLWDMPLDLTGQREAFLTIYEEVEEGPVIAYMLSDPRNPASVKSLLANARENARATRHFLTTDVWECINRTWLHIADKSYKDIQRDSLEDYLEWFIERSYMFKGVMHGSMRRGEGLLFANLGQAIDRADYSARMLNVHFNSITESKQGRLDTLQVRDYYRSTLLLNALNAYKAYREAFHSSIELDKIAELFILHKEVPRSLKACVYDIAELVRTLNPTASVMKDIYDLQYRLDTVKIAQLRRVGLGFFLSDFSKQMDEISLNIQKDFMMVQ